jgi:hypothetical protein
MAWRRLLVALAAVPLLALSLQSNDAPGIDLLVQRAGAYVRRFQTSFANVVAEESYLQRAPAWAARDGHPEGRVIDIQRELKSDFLFVKVPSGDAWLPFRDVFAVDGKPVRDREERLTKLFVHPSPTALEQARQIVADSTRYNIGGIERDLNLPIVTLLAVAPDNQHRFRFTSVSRRASKTVWAFDFTEESHPTLVRGSGGHDIPSRGRIWFDMAADAIVKTEMWTEDDTIHVHLTTTYRDDPKFGIAVPIEMEERLEVPATGAKVTGFAKYGNFRRFNVETTEKVGI